MFLITAAFPPFSALASVDRFALDHIADFKELQRANSTISIYYFGNCMATAVVNVTNAQTSRRTNSSNSALCTLAGFPLKYRKHEKMSKIRRACG